MIDLPTISDLIRAYHGAITGRRDEFADDNTGSGYNIIAGSNSIIFSRLAQRDEDNFRSIRFNHADGDELTDMGNARYSIPRVESTQGVGVALVSRPTTSAGAGTIWAGTIIRVLGDLSQSKIYEVTSDVIVGAAAFSAVVPVNAVLFGTGHGIGLSGPGARFDDPLWDNSWVVTSLNCADGTDLESPDAYRARVRQARKDARLGFRTAIETACENAGAVHVAMFASDYAPVDFGLNVVYVGDSSYTGSAKLIKACKVALDSVRNAGDQMQVLPMAPNSLIVNVTVQLANPPSAYNLNLLTQLVSDSIIQYIGKDGAFGYKLAGVAASILRTVPDAQQVTFATPSSDATILTNISGVLWFPSVLQRTFLSPNNITVSFA